MTRQCISLSPLTRDIRTYSLQDYLLLISHRIYILQYHVHCTVASESEIRFFYRLI